MKTSTKLKCGHSVWDVVITLRAGKFIWMSSNQQTNDSPYSQDLRVKRAKKKSKCDL